MYMSARKSSDYATKAAQELVASHTSMSPEQNLYRESETRAMLSHYGGGNVHLEKDNSTGIARMLIENNGKKNAFSGRCLL
jgi:hypothetical protein